MRATLLGIGEQVSLDGLAECDLWPNRQIAFHAALVPGIPHELPSLKFVPQAAGAEVIRFEVTLKGAEMVPLGRWSASKDLIVEDVVQQTGPITAEKGATVIVSTGPFAGITNQLQGLTELAPKWLPIPLQLDNAFQLRLRNACPATPAGTPPAIDTSRLWRASNPMHAALQFENRATGQRFSVAVVCAQSASFGRGGDPAVAWWLMPAHYDQAQHSRLSRRHTAITLHAGRAWVTDHSTNGTRLNRQPVIRDAPPELLSQGDRVDLAGVIPLTISELCVHKQQVHSLWVDRGDSLTGQLRYLLTDGSVPLALRCKPGEAPILWIVWLRGPDSSPQLAGCVPGSRWVGIPPGKHALFEPCRIFWQPFEMPCEQEHYVRS